MKIKPFFITACLFFCTISKNEIKKSGDCQAADLYPKRTLGFIAEETRDYKLNPFETFMSNIIEVSEYSMIIVSVHAIPSSAKGVLFLEFSPNKIDWDRVITLPVIDPMNEPPHALLPISRYFRVRYTNDSIAQSVFRLQIMLHKGAAKGLTHRLEETIGPTTDVEMVRAVVVGRNPQGQYKNVEISDTSSFQVDIGGPLSIQGELPFTNLIPVVQLHWIDGINTEVARTRTYGSGTVVADNAEIIVGTGSTTGSLASIQSRRRMRYIPCDNTEIMFTARFTQGVSGTKQLIGIGDEESGLFFGYRDSSFGIFERSKGQVEIRMLTITTSAKRDGLLTIQLNGGVGVTVNVVKNDTIGEIAKKIANADFSSEGGGFRTSYSGDRVFFFSSKAEPRDGVYSFTPRPSDRTDIQGSFSRKVVGVAATETFTNQLFCTADKAQGDNILPNIDFDKGNIYKIQYQWLGYGIINFFIENPETGKFVLIHQAFYMNKYVTPYSYNATLPLSIFADNETTTSDVVVYSTAMVAKSQGVPPGQSPHFSATSRGGFSSKSKKGKLVLLALHAKEVFGNKMNKTRVVVDFYSLGNANGGKMAEFSVYKNPTFVGTPSFVSVNDRNSVVEIDKSCSEISGGELIFATYIGKETGDTQLLVSTPIELFPGDTLAFVGATMKSRGNNDDDDDDNEWSRSSHLKAACSWFEDV